MFKIEARPLFNSEHVYQAPLASFIGLKAHSNPNLPLFGEVAMYSDDYTVEVAGLSIRAMETDIHDFFIHCGDIEHVEIIRSGEYARTAYVTFKDAYAMNTAILLSGAQIGDQIVHISRRGFYVDESDIWDPHSWMAANQSQSTGTEAGHYVSTPGEAVTVAQEVVVKMIEKGYLLSKDALTKARAFDQSYQVSASAGAKMAELSSRMGLTDKICDGMAAMKSVDEKYRVSEVSKSAAEVTGKAAVATGRTAAAAASAVVNSSYFAKCALWVSDALTRAAKVAADLGTHPNQK